MARPAGFGSRNAVGRCPRHSGASPPDPAPHVQPKPDGGIGLPRLVLIKPDGTGGELLDGLCGQGKTFRAEPIAEEIEAALDAPDEGLVRVVNFRFWL